MVDVSDGIGAHKEAMLVHILITAVNVREDCNGFLFFGLVVNIEEICWVDVECCCVGIEQGVELGCAEAVVSQLWTVNLGVFI